MLCGVKREKTNLRRIAICNRMVMGLKSSMSLTKICFSHLGKSIFKLLPRVEQDIVPPHLIQAILALDAMGL